MERRIIKRVRATFPQHVGELFIATPLHLWDETLRAWQNDAGRPCPLAPNHIAFREPEVCGFELVN